MQITQVETIWLDEFPNLCWVRIYTDDGLVGLGETFFGAQAVEAYLHESVAPLILGEDPLRIDWIANRLVPYTGYRSGGAELRGNSAVDIALWDLFGKAVNKPIYQLLGGKFRDRIRIYNTCAGYTYTRKEPRQAVANWGIEIAPPEVSQAEARPSAEPDRPYEDLEAFLYRADELANSLMNQGITAMKIWPFDPYAEASNGTYISHQELQTALEPFRKIRQAVGDDMDIMVELHGLWNLPMAKKILAALEEFNCFWYEDPIRPNNFEALAELASITTVPITLSETIATRWGFREVMAARASGIVMLDVTWCGGLGEAKKISTIAEAHQLPVAPHDCTGPVALVASTHLSLNAPNALIQETVRSAYTDWYRDLVTALPDIGGGAIGLSEAPGLGTELRPELLLRDDVHSRLSSIE